jgi:hypothetical protein
LRHSITFKRRGEDNTNSGKQCTQFSNIDPAKRSSTDQDNDDNDKDNDDNDQTNDDNYQHNDDNTTLSNASQNETK